MWKILKRLFTNKQLKLLFLFLTIMGLVTSCASLSDVDRDKLNHPAMDFKQSQTPQLGTPLTSLNSFRDGQTSGGCGSCAK